MPTKKSIISVVVDHDIHQIYKAYSQETGQSVSSYVYSLMVQTAPMVEKLTQMAAQVRDLKQTPTQAADEITQLLNALETQITSSSTAAKNDLKNVIEFSSKK